VPETGCFEDYDLQTQSTFTLPPIT